MHSLIQLACRCLLVFSLALSQASFAAPPNVLVIVADDIAYGDRSCYGNKDIVTPNLDAIAAGGTRFASGYVMARACGASRAAILSGRYPSHIDALKTNDAQEVSFYEQRGIRYREGFITDQEEPIEPILTPLVAAIAQCEGRHQNSGNRRP